MFTFLKKMFGKEGAATATLEAAPVAAAPQRAAAERERPVGGGVEVANLSLRVILDKMPQELKSIVNQMPDESVTIVLPVNTILKQLPGGHVKMSLASLLRQAPPGTFRKTAVEDKQMVDVPLSEIFKCVDPRRLHRRNDQRIYDVPDDAAGLFGTDGSTRSLGAAATPARHTPRAEAATAQDMEDTIPSFTPAKAMKGPSLTPAPEPPPASSNGSLKMPLSTPPPKSSPPKSAGPGMPGHLVLSFVELAAGWPEGVRSELTFLTGETRLVVPASAVGPGLQKGKVSFPWSQVRGWFKPPFSQNVSIPDDQEIVFPLKIVAPAFVAATGAAKRREAAEIDQSLPDFFGPTSGQVPKPAPAPAAPAPAEPEPEPAPMPLSSATAPTVILKMPAPQAAPEPEPAPVAEAAPLKLSFVPEPPPAPAAPEPAAEPAPSPSSPAEIVLRICDMGGVAGAVIALEEGLVVAQKMPESLSADTFAAFMPQIFSRLERHAADMQLGETTEVTLHTAQGPCHFVRHGKIYLGVLGHAGGTLPDGLGAFSKSLAARNP